jgi:hypothetical protein
LLNENRQKLAALKKRDRWLGLGKVALGIAAVVLLGLALEAHHGFRWVAAAAVVFAALAVVHERVLTRIAGVEAIAALYERGLARLEDRWAGAGEGGERFTNETHAYARDLDLFGAGSLFELLCVVRTRAGEETLARWLLEAADPAEVAARQDAVREVKDRLDFRERLFTAGNRVRLGVHPEKLVEWGERESRFKSKAAPVVAGALGALWVASLIYGLAVDSFRAMLLMSAVNLSVDAYLRKRVGAEPEAIEAATSDLDLLAEVLRILEAEKFDSEKLRGLQRALRAEGTAPSAAVKKLDRITEYLEHGENLIVRVLDRFVFYTVQWTMRAEAWRGKYGRAIRGWLAAVGEMEALAALAGYAFEHPEDTWPEVSEGAARFEAEGMAHPLLAERGAVRNDLKLGDGLQLIVLSGPNMSGKSTFIRGIGVNAVLAQAGAPVRARRLRMSPLAIGASICVLDSLQGGVSRFYAEIKRLKVIRDKAQGKTALLFLLDELLSGTNSHDRLEGTAMVVNALVEHGAIGLVTTHDLALARIPETMAGRARNYHFEDRVEDGKLIFDFKLKEGVVETSNALKLMEGIGLVGERGAGG